MSGRTILLGPLPPPYGGVAIFTARLFELVRMHGVRLWFYGEGTSDDPQATRFRPRSLDLPALVLREGRNAWIVDSSHFLVEHPHPLMVPVWCLLKRLVGFKWLKVVHDGSLPARYESFGFLRRKICRLALRSVDEFAVVNDDIGSFLRRVGVTRQISTANALLPLAQRKPTTVASEFSRARLKHSKVICSTGVFTTNYGFHQVAECAELLRERTQKDIGLVLIDGKFVSDPEYRKNVVQNRDWITVLENVPHPQVLEMFRQSDVFVRGFRYEGYGLSRIEAVWCGLPVIAAMGEESRGMWLYEFGDNERLTQALMETLFQPSPERVAHWAKVFQDEAESNLKRWKKLMRLTMRQQVD